MISAPDFIKVPEALHEIQPPEQERSECGAKIKFFASLSFKKETEVQGEEPCPPEASRKKPLSRTNRHIRER